MYTTLQEKSKWAREQWPADSRNRPMRGIYVIFGVSLLVGLLSLTALISALIKNGVSVSLIKGQLRANRGK
jgi:hypothetical protein